MELECKTETNEQQAASVREFVIKVEDELQKFRDGILALMDKNFIPSASTGESKTTHYTRVGDYNRYLAELATAEAESKTAEDARVVFAEATKITEKFSDRAGDMPVMLQRQVPVIQQVLKTVEVPHMCSALTRSSMCLS